MIDTEYDTGPVGQCPACQGEKVVNGVACTLCKGLGAIGDSGPAPERQPGLCGFRIGTDCARSWIGAGAPDLYRAEQLELWKAQGMEARALDFSEAAPLLTQHGQCGGACLFPAERRSEERPTVPAVIDLSDLPPGGIRLPDPNRIRVVAVQIHNESEDVYGSVTHVILTADLSDGTHRECEVVLPREWTA